MRRIDLDMYITSTLCDINDFEKAINDGFIVDNNRVLIFLHDLKCRFLEMQSELEQE